MLCPLKIHVENQEYTQEELQEAITPGGAVILDVRLRRKQKQPLQARV